MKKTGVLENSLIWFGAAVSIAEILTGTLFAGLGLGPAIAAILLGHLIGGGFLYLAGLIGAKTERCAMDTAKMTFGRWGGVFFAVLNLVQLVGWTAVMITSGAAAAGSVLSRDPRLFAAVIGALILLWILLGIKNLGKLNLLAMAALLLLVGVLCLRIFTAKGGATPPPDSLSFGAAVELSAAMPISWLPLISDYTHMAEKKKKATAASVLTYSVTSIWMYLIGMGAARLAGAYDVGAILGAARLGLLAVVIVLLSTVTTTFMDAYSGGVSAGSILSRLPERWAAVAVTVIGTAIALLFPQLELESFLYQISAVFAPMISVQLADYFILKRDHTKKALSLLNLILWAIGFGIYQLFLQLDTPIGSTLPSMIAVLLLAVAVGKLQERREKA